MPLRGIVYAAAARASPALVAGALPPTRWLDPLVPWYLRDVGAPARGGVRCSASVRDRRAPVPPRRGRAARRTSPGARRSARCAPLARARRAGARRRSSCIPDGSDARFRALRYRGPGAVLVAPPAPARASGRGRGRADVTLHPLAGRGAARDRARARRRRGARGAPALMAWRRPLSFVYGNCVHGACGPWALFALEPHGYATLPAERKRERFGRAAGGDRGARGRHPAAARRARVGPERRARRARARLRAARTRGCTRATSTAQLAGLARSRAASCRRSTSRSASSRRSATSARSSPALAERRPRELARASLRGALRAGRGAAALGGRARAAARARRRDARAPVAAYLDARPARTRRGAVARAAGVLPRARRAASSTACTSRRRSSSSATAPPCSRRSRPT